MRHPGARLQARVARAELVVGAVAVRVHLARRARLQVALQRRRQQVQRRAALRRIPLRLRRPSHLPPTAGPAACGPARGNLSSSGKPLASPRGARDVGRRQPFQARANALAAPTPPSIAAGARAASRTPDAHPVVEHGELRAGVQQQRGRAQVAPVQRAVQAGPGARPRAASAAALRGPEGQAAVRCSAKQHLPARTQLCVRATLSAQRHDPPSRTRDTPPAPVYSPSEAARGPSSLRAMSVAVTARPSWHKRTSPTRHPAGPLLHRPPASAPQSAGGCATPGAQASRAASPAGSVRAGQPSG